MPYQALPVMRALPSTRAHAIFFRTLLHRFEDACQFAESPILLPGTRQFFQRTPSGVLPLVLTFESTPTVRLAGVGDSDPAAGKQNACTLLRPIARVDVFHDDVQKQCAPDGCAQRSAASVSSQFELRNGGARPRDAPPPLCRAATIAGVLVGRSDEAPQGPDRSFICLLREQSPNP